MNTHRCPGMDIRFWKPKDIFEIECPHCGDHIEFWKDDPLRKCPGCGQKVNNPHIDLGCAKWCKYAKECLATLSETQVSAAPLLDRLNAGLGVNLATQPFRLRHASEVCAFSEKLLAAEEGGEPYIVKSGALLAGALISEAGELSAASAQDVSCLNSFEARQNFLEQAGLEPAIAAEICDILEAIMSDRPLDTQEYKLIWDAVQLEQFSLRRKYDNADDDFVRIITHLKTSNAKHLIKRILKSDAQRLPEES